MVIGLTVRVHVVCTVRKRLELPGLKISLGATANGYSKAEIDEVLRSCELNKLVHVPSTLLFYIPRSSH